MTQLELLELIDNNPLKIKAQLSATDINNAENYIFVDRLQDKPIYADNKAQLYNSDINIGVFCMKASDRDLVIKYLKSVFNGTPSFTYDNNYFIGNFETSVIVSDW